jgi:arylformamidase
LRACLANGGAGIPSSGQPARGKAERLKAYRSGGKKRRLSAPGSHEKCWLNANAAEHGIQGPIVVTGWSAGGHLTSFILGHPKVAAGLAISGVFDLGALRDSPHVNDKVKLSEEEVENLSPMRRPIVNKPLGIVYGTGELSCVSLASACPRRLVPIANTNHFTILDDVRQPNGTLTRAVIAMAQYQTA